VFIDQALADGRVEIREHGVNALPFVLPVRLACNDSSVGPLPVGVDGFRMIAQCLCVDEECA
jgi:hypothetical protein